MAEDDYLQEGFDPRSVTIPRLRSILVTHNVDYPSTAKKPQLVELVNDHVLSQASKLRAERARAKRSSFGIVNAGSAQDTGTWDDDEVATPRRRSKTPRKSSSRLKSEENELTVPRARSASKRSSRSVSRQLSMDPEEISEYESRSSRRSTRTATPQIKPEPEYEEQAEIDEDIVPSYEEDQPVFTDDNPFQSGSPPSASTNRRRTTGGVTSRSEKTARRRTGGTPSVEATAPSRRRKSPEFLMEPGEEFTPDAQLEIEEATNSGELSARQKSPVAGSRRKGSAATPFFVLLLSLVGAYLAWYRQEKIAVGYCDLGRPATQIIPIEIQDKVPDALLPFIEPECEQCPQHAFCYEDFSVRCHDDFILQPHPLSLGGLVPLPPTCEPDSEKARRVKAVADKAIEELRDRRAKFECGELTDDAGQPTDTPAIAEEELKESVSRKRAKKLSNQEFDELWDAAIGDITDREEVEIQTETTESPDSPDFPIRRLSSTSLARISISCAIKRSIRSRLARYRLPIGLVGILVFSILYLRRRYRKHVAATAQVPALVDLVLGRLANQKELGDEDLDDPWLFLPNLRDDVLRSVHSLADRERIWQKVKSVVDQNSNVRTSQREGRSGEVGRAWEWIGPVKGEGARRRRSGRMSWAPEAMNGTPEPAGNPVEMKKWEESRPIY